MGPNSALHGHSRILDPLNGGLNLGLRHPENHSMVPYRGRSTKFLFYRFKPSPPTHKHMNQLGTVYTCDPSLGWNPVSTEKKKIYTTKETRPFFRTIPMKSGLHKIKRPMDDGCLFIYRPVPFTNGPVSMAPSNAWTHDTCQQRYLVSLPEINVFFFFFLNFILYVILFYKFWVYLSDVRTIHWSSACPWIDVGLYWQTWASLGTEQYERDVTQLGGYADTTSRPWNRDGIDDCTIHIVSLLVHSEAYARIKK